MQNWPNDISSSAVKPAAVEVAVSLTQLIYELQDVDLESPLAKLNETTISDNNGGRICL